MNDEQLAAAKAAHKRIAVAEVDGVTIVLRRPKRPEFDSFWETDKRPADFRRLILDCLVSPDRATVESLLDEYPTLAIGDLGATCLKLASPEGKAVVRTL